MQQVSSRPGCRAPAGTQTVRVYYFVASQLGHQDTARSGLRDWCWHRLERKREIEGGDKVYRLEARR